MRLGQRPVESDLRQARAALEGLVGPTDWSAVWVAVQQIAVRPVLRWPLAVSLALVIALGAFSGALGPRLPAANAQAITVPTAPLAVVRPVDGTAPVMAAEPLLVATRALTAAVVHTPAPPRSVGSP
jgi:hypothetical protein